MQISELEVGQKVSFEIYPSHIHGSTFNNVTISAFFDYKLANALGFDIISAHNMVFPSLPIGIPNDPTQYNYVQVTSESGKTLILGTPWIINNTIVVGNGRKLTLVFQDINETRKGRIINAIKHINEVPDNIEFN